MTNEDTMKKTLRISAVALVAGTIGAALWMHNRADASNICC